MAPRPFWKGYLKLSLVTCPVAMTPAITASEKVRFHTLNRATGHRVESRYVDAVTDEPVAEDDEVKGYQTGGDDYVMLEDDELEAVALESTHTIDIEKFVPEDSIEWIWYDRPHFLTPDDPVAAEAYAVIRSAMQATGMVGISRLVLYRREHAVMLKPRDKGIVLWTLRYGDEVRDAKPYFGEAEKKKVDPKLLSLAKDLIAERSAAWDPAMVSDPVQAKLLDIIAAKRKRKRPPKQKSTAPPERGGNVVSIMDALRKSIRQEADKRRR